MYSRIFGGGYTRSYIFRARMRITTSRSRRAVPLNKINPRVLVYILFYTAVHNGGSPTFFFFFIFNHIWDTFRRRGPNFSERTITVKIWIRYRLFYSTVIIRRKKLFYCETSHCCDIMRCFRMACRLKCRRIFDQTLIVPTSTVARECPVT